MLSLEDAVRQLCPDWRSPQNEFDEMARDPATYFRVPRDITNIIKAYAFHGQHLVLYRPQRVMPDMATVFPESLADEQAEFHIDGKRCWAILRTGRLTRDYEICRVFDYEAWRNDRKVIILAESMATRIVYKGGRVVFVEGGQTRIMILVGNRIVSGSNEPYYHLCASMGSYYGLECGCVLRREVVNFQNKYYLENDSRTRSIEVRGELALRTIKWT